LFLFVVFVFAFAPILTFIVAMISRHLKWSSGVTIYMIGSSVCVPLLAALADIPWLIGVLLAAWTPQVLAIVFYEWLDHDAKSPRRQKR
jgi:hypothetical protein